MIALIGYSKFPIFYSEKILGSKSGIVEFDDWVRNLDKSKEAVAVYTFSDLKLKRRFVINNFALNPFLSVKEKIPPRVFNYPDLEPDSVLKNVYAYGIVFKGVRQRIFFPLIPLRELERKEADALLNVTRVKKFALDRMVDLLRNMGIDVEVRELVDRYAFTINDPEVNREYVVYTDGFGRVLDTNFCVELSEQLYLPELAILVREERYIHVWH